MAIDKSRRLRPPLAEEALYGLPGAVARTLAAETGADEATVLVMFLTAFGNALGRTPYIQFYQHEEPGRLFSLIVGDLARGRKGTAWTMVRKLFTDADPDWMSRVRAGVQSPEAMIELVEDGVTPDPRLLILETEFARLVQGMERAKGFSAQMRNAYDGETLSRKRVNKPEMVSTRHNISMVGMITGRELTALTKIAGGLESRILYVWSAPGRDGEGEPFGGNNPTIATLAGEVRTALEHASNYVFRGIDPVSVELMLMRKIRPSAQFYMAEDIASQWKAVVAREVEGLADYIGEDFARYTARGQTHVVRLSLLYALADNADEVRWEHVRAAMALWEFCATSAWQIFSFPGSTEAKIDPKKRDKVYSYLCEAVDSNGNPQWIAKTIIWADVFGRSRHVKGGEVDAIMEDLLSRDLIEIRHVGARTNKKTEYRAK